MLCDRFKQNIHLCLILLNITKYLIWWFHFSQMLRDRFKEFARDTENIGTERVSAVNEICDQLISAEHSDAATIAEWKDQLNEAWENLLELIDTRTQMLAASWQLHKFFHDCKETLERIYEKSHSIPDELGNNAQSVAALQRRHANFEHDLQTLGTQVSYVNTFIPYIYTLHSYSYPTFIFIPYIHTLQRWHANFEHDLQTLGTQVSYVNTFIPYIYTIHSYPTFIFIPYIHIYTLHSYPTKMTRQLRARPTDFGNTG